MRFLPNKNKKNINKRFSLLIPSKKEKQKKKFYVGDTVKSHYRHSHSKKGFVTRQTSCLTINGRILNEEFFVSYSILTVTNFQVIRCKTMLIEKREDCFDY
jgi:hypothetical protein